MLVACGSSGAGLIPSANAGPLLADFEAVARPRESAMATARHRSGARATPNTTSRRCRRASTPACAAKLQEGIAHLRPCALETVRRTARPDHHDRRIDTSTTTPPATTKTTTTTRPPAPPHRPPPPRTSTAPTGTTRAPAPKAAPARRRRQRRQHPEGGVAAVRGLGSGEARRRQQRRRGGSERGHGSGQ